MKKIVVNIRSTSATLTGVQRYTLEMLARIGSDMTVVKPARPLQGSIGHLWEQCVLPTKVGGGLLWSPSNTGPLAVHSQVVSIHDVAALDHPEWMTKKFSAWYRYLTPKLVARVKRVITCSEFTKKRILHHCPGVAEKISVIYLGADKVFRPVSPVDVAAAVYELQLPSTQYILALGSLEPRKNLKNLLDAWRAMQGTVDSNVWLVLAGAKGKAAIFANGAVGELPPRVYLTGHVADRLLPALYAGAICSAYVSLYEGFGLPALEAMSCGTPMLTSNSTSLPEVVGDAALTVPPTDVNAIASGLLRIVGNSHLRAQMREKGLQRAALFSWERAAAETKEILDQEASK